MSTVPHLLQQNLGVGCEVGVGGWEEEGRGCVEEVKSIPAEHKEVIYRR